MGAHREEIREEVRVSLFQMGLHKVARLDGFMQAWFQKNWTFVGVLVNYHIEAIFIERKIQCEENYSLTCLILKISPPNYVPLLTNILCNVLSKLVIKILAN